MDEFALIRQHFASLTPPAADVVLGIGDDAALLAVPAAHELVVTTDTLVAGRHFPERTDPADIGWKALAVNLSDLAAMGATARWFTLALTLPEVDAGWLTGFAAGLGALARKTGVALVGGDTTRGPLAISITAMGTVPACAALRRDSARVGDLVCVTGTLGDAALALALHDDVREPPPAEDLEYLRARLDRPSPRLDAGLALCGLARAAIDLSDGLAGDLGHILEASGVGAEIDPGLLPMSPAFAARAQADRRLHLQASGGDDYELCVCLLPSALEAARAALGALPLTVVGRITEARGLRWLDTHGGPVAGPQHGYRHF